MEGPGHCGQIVFPADELVVAYRNVTDGARNQVGKIGFQALRHHLEASFRFAESSQAYRAQVTRLVSIDCITSRGVDGW